MHCYCDEPRVYISFIKVAFSELEQRASGDAWALMSALIVALW
jgi:hypothetical protein